MSTAATRQTGYGVGSPKIGLAPPPIPAQRAPASSDLNYPLGQFWINESTGDSYQLTSFGAGVANWIVLGGSSSAIATINSNAPVAGNYVLAGTANQISVAQTTGTTTFSLPSAINAPGSLTTTTTLAAGTSVTAGTTITATLGAITATNGNLVLGTAGNKLSIATGANASIGTSVAMTAGTVTVSTTADTASSIIFLSVNTPGGTQGTLSAPTASIVAGTSFVINSSSNTDTSTVNWWIVN